LNYREIKGQKKEFSKTDGWSDFLGPTHLARSIRNVITILHEVCPQN
jgi:hypothetical protein